MQLRLHFKADLYPFYPPRVSLVRPKLEGFVPGAMIAHPKLHLRNWQDLVSNHRMLPRTFPTFIEPHGAHMVSKIHLFPPSYVPSYVRFTPLLAVPSYVSVSPILRFLYEMVHDSYISSSDAASVMYLSLA